MRFYLKNGGAYIFQEGNMWLADYRQPPSWYDSRAKAVEALGRFQSSVPWSAGVGTRVVVVYKPEGETREREATVL